MSNPLSSIAVSLRRHPGIVFIWLAIITLLAVGIGIGISDYETNLAGYLMLPGNKINTWVPYLVALIPQLGQIILFYVYITDTSKKWTLIVLGLLHFVDMATDVVFMTPGWDWASIALTVFQAEVIYTIGSHVIVTLTLGLAIDLWPDVKVHFKNFLVGKQSGGPGSGYQAPPFPHSTQPPSSSSGRSSGGPDPLFRGGGRKP
jgi:hypothetical protein